MNQFFSRMLVLLLVLAWSSGCLLAAAASRTIIDLDEGWRFSRGDFAAAMMPAFNDGAWQTVNLPHDWSSDGPFSAEHGSGNGYAPGGIGWYRKHFALPDGDTNKVIAVEFDGIYDYSQVCCWSTRYSAPRAPL